MQEDKSLEEKAVDIRGKKYVLVQDRVLYFNDKYPDGQITTDAKYHEDIKTWVVKATVFVPARIGKDGSWAVDMETLGRRFTGHSQAVIGEGMVNKTAALENAETSAVGRALAFMGIGVIESIASADEMVKASVAPKTAPGRTGSEDEALRREKAKKDRILANLKRLGKSVKDKGEIAQAVFDLVGLELVPEKYDEIGEALGKLR